MFGAEFKTVSASTSGTKRRKWSIPPYSQSATQYLNKRVSRLYKQVKLKNPLHLYSFSMGGQFTSISTTGTLYNMASSIAQGDAPTDRFSSQCILRRVNIKGSLIPGTTAVYPANVRITIFRGLAGISFAANMTSTYNPIAYSTSTRVIYDKFFQVSSTAATAGFPCSFNLSIKLNHKQKFTGAAAATQTGDCLYLIIQSDQAAGTTAPLALGVVEIYFDPT